MNDGEPIVSLGKLIVASAASSPFFNALTSYVQTPVWGIPVTVIGAAGAGAILSLFFGDPLTTRRDLFGQTIGATIFGCAVAYLVADAFNWGWAAKNMSMFALMSSAILRWFLPTIIDRVKQLIREFKFSFLKKPDGGDK